MRLDLKVTIDSYAAKYFRDRESYGFMLIKYNDIPEEIKENMKEQWDENNHPCTFYINKRYLSSKLDVGNFYQINLKKKLLNGKISWEAVNPVLLDPIKSQFDSINCNRYFDTSTPTTAGSSYIDRRGRSRSRDLRSGNGRIRSPSQEMRSRDWKPRSSSREMRSPSREMRSLDWRPRSRSREMRSPSRGRRSRDRELIQTMLDILSRK